MNNICENCVYWCLRNDDWIDYVRGECQNEKFVEDMDTPKDGLSYHDYEGYSAALYTGPKFGCIHFKRKE